MGTLAFAQSRFSRLLPFILSLLLSNISVAQTAPPINSECSHKTQLTPGIPGSPSNHIRLPNRDPGVSELAAIMRNIYNALVAQKAALEAGNPLPELTDFSRASCAWATDPSTRTPQFDGFAHVMNHTLMQHATTQTQASFNQVVTTCIACHQHYCPGPVSAIEDLMLT